MTALYVMNLVLCFAAGLCAGVLAFMLAGQGERVKPRRYRKRVREPPHEDAQSQQDMSDDEFTRELQAILDYDGGLREDTEE